MFRSIEDFLATWRHEQDATHKLYAKLTDASLSQPVVEGGRTLGFIAWHTVQTLGEMMARVGLKVDAPAEHDPVPAHAAEIVAALDRASASLLEQIKTKWTDATLLEEDDMYGERWKRGTTLHALVAHHAHHRGQITVLMRQAGIAPSGVYGPAKEEWKAFGMEPLP